MSYSPVFILFFSPFLPFNPLIFVFISYPSSVISQATQLDSCFLEAAVDSDHLLLSSACCLSSPLENERGHSENHEHLCIVGYGKPPKLAKEQTIPLWAANVIRCSCKQGLLCFLFQNLTLKCHLYYPPFSLYCLHPDLSLKFCYEIKYSKNLNLIFFSLCFVWIPYRIF